MNNNFKKEKKLKDLSNLNSMYHYAISAMVREEMPQEAINEITETMKKLQNSILTN